MGNGTMVEPAQRGVGKARDVIQERLTNYAVNLNYDTVAPEAVSAARVRLINTCGALMAGFFSDPGRVVRRVAAQFPNPGATVIGTRSKTTPDVAALVNTATAGYVEMGDTYHWPGSYHGHPSDVIMPVLAVAEFVNASGRELITAIVLAYEIYLRFSDVFHNEGFDYTTFGCVSTAVAAGKLLGLSPEQMSHAISMAVVPNNILKQARRGQLSMFKSAAAGHAGRAGVFAALLGRAGMEGPHLPFEGKAGWCEHVARERLSLGSFGAEVSTSFKILDTRIKNRSSSGPTISAILAAEKVAPLRNLKEVTQVTVEAYKLAIERGADGDRGNPQSPETADHSIPYLVAVTLMDGTVTRRSFNEAHLWNPDLRALMQKIKVVENEAFTRAYEGVPVEHRMRITVVTRDGAQLVGESGGDHEDLSGEMSDEQIEQKFRGLTEDYLGARQARAILDRLWRLEELQDVAVIPPSFAIV